MSVLDSFNNPGGSSGDTSAWPSIGFRLLPRDDRGAPLASPSTTGGPVELLQVFAGTTGPSGPPYKPNEFSAVASADGLQVLTLPSVAASGGTLYINGLAQSRHAYVVAGTAISLPADLNVIAGDLLTFIYPI